MSRLPALLPAALLLAGMLASRPAARAAELEEALPESTVVLVKVADWAKTRKDLDATALGKILAEEDVREYLKGVGQVFDKLVAAMEKKTGVKSADFQAAYGTELAFALTGIELVKRKVSRVTVDDKGNEKAVETEVPETAVTIALVARVGDAAAAARVNATIEAAAKGARPSAPVEWGRAKGLRIETPEKTFPFYSVSAGAYKLWAFGGSEARVRELAEALAAGSCEKSLAASADFKLCRGKLGARADLLWYLGIKRGVDQLLAALDERDRAGTAKVLEALRLGDLSAAAGSVAVDAPGFRSRSFLACKEGDDGIVGLVGREPLPPEILKLAPANATGLAAGSFRFDRVFPLIRKAVAAGDKDAAAEMDKGLAGLKQAIGVDLEKDLLGALSGRGCVFVMPGQSVGGNPLLGQVNGLVLAAEVKDAAALRGAAEKLVELAKAALAGRGGPPDEELGGKAAQDLVATFDYRGQKITSFNLTVLSPGFAVTDKYLLVGGSVQAVKKAIAQAAGGGEALVDTPAYKKAMSAVESKDATSITYMNTSDSVATGVASAGMLAGLLPAITQVRGNAQRANSKSNLRQVGLACHIWADDNDEKFPPDLLALFPKYVDNKKLYQSPTYSKHAADGVDYAYVAGLVPADPGDTILAYEPVAGANGLVNVLYVDAHVAAAKLEDVKKALEAQAKKLKDNKREMKIIEPKGVEGGAAPDEVGTEELFFDLLKAALNPAAMPAPDSFTKHLFPAVSVTRRVEGGLLSESFSPLGFTGGMGTDAKGVAVVGISIGLLLPAVSRVRENARMANSKSNLRMIGLACHIFADDNDENFPPNLAALLPNYVDTKKLFLCPMYTKHAADGFDYAYVAGLRAADPGAYIMAFETLPNRNGQVNALYVDAHVQILGIEELRKQLAEQAKKLKDDKREMKILAPKDVGRPGAQADEVIINTDVVKEKAPPPAPPAPAPK